jgi:putative inorganic carbon (HCO3(-)) transporter
MAGILVVLIPLILGGILFDWSGISRTGKIFLVGAGLLSMTTLVLTQSRAALIAFAAVVLVFVALRFHRGWTVIPIGAGALLLAAVLMGQEEVRTGLSPFIDLEGFADRRQIWVRAISIIRDFPITGVGMGLFGPITARFYPFFIVRPPVSHAHNLFLQVGVDLGIPGLAAWLAIVLLVFRTNWKIFTGGLKPLGAGLLCSQVALVVHGMLDAVTWGSVKTAPVVWSLWALSFSALEILRKDGQETGPATGAGSLRNII